MALEYTLSTDIKFSELIETIIINNFGMGYSQITKSEKLIKINYYDTLGFNVSIFKYKKGIKYLSFKFIYEMSIIFRLDKNFDNILEQKKNILKILLLLLNASSELIFTFNGDNLLLMKNSNDILINKYYGFWDNQELEKMFNKLNYNEIHENEEIEYYPIK